MFRKTVLAIVMAGAYIALPVYAQSEEAARQDVAVQGFGSFVTTTTHNEIDNKQTNSGGVLASYRYFLSPHHGVEASYGYELPAGVIGVKTNSHEITGAYILRMPLRKFTPFALAGVGALVFDPRNFTGASTQARAAFVYGTGADLNISSHISLRAEYRGFVYNSPTYDLPAFAGMDRISHRAEPSVGIGYSF